MTSKFPIVVCLLGIILFLSCHQNDSNNPSIRTRIQGEISGAISDKFVLFAGETKLNLCKLDNQTFFTCNFKQTRPYLQYLLVANDTIEVFTRPGDSLYIHLNYQNDSLEVSFSGSHANENTFYQLLKKKRKQLLFAQLDSLEIFEEKEFSNRIENIILDLNSFQQNYEKINGTFDEYFADQLVQENRWASAIVRMNFAIQNRITSDSSKVITETYNSFLQNIEIENEKHIHNLLYRQFLKLLVAFELPNYPELTPKNDSIIPYDFIESYFRNSVIIDYLLYNSMSEKIDENIDLALNSLDLYQRYQSNEYFSNIITDKINRNSYLSRGSSVKEVSVIDSKGGNVSLFQKDNKQQYSLFLTSNTVENEALLGKLIEYLKNKNTNSISFTVVSNSKAIFNFSKNYKSYNQISFCYIDQMAWEEMIKYFKISKLPFGLATSSNVRLISSRPPLPNNELWENWIENYYYFDTLTNQ